VVWLTIPIHSKLDVWVREGLGVGIRMVLLDSFDLVGSDERRWLAQST
jgi:hypothetical protein